MGKNIFYGTKITKIGETNDKITARGGLPLFLRYVENIGLYKLMTGTLISLFVSNGEGLRAAVVAALITRNAK